LLRRATNAGVAYDTNGKASSETGKANRKTCAKLDDAGKESHTLSD